jgi:membrane protease YdiL (CAAX protease family)
LLINYLRLRTSFHGALQIGGEVFAGNPNAWEVALRRSGFGALAGYLWWGGWHLVGYVLIPVVVIRGVLRDRLRDYGLGLGKLTRHWPWYVLLVSPILVFVVIASHSDAFLRQYPFYRFAGRSWFDLLAWEVIYLSQFVALEFFFRGFFLFGLRRVFGVAAVAVMCVPYLMIHFPKPWPEAAGAILFGLFLGILALRSRTIWGGVAVHMTVAASMDFAALLQGGNLPSQWWPF